MAAPNRPRVYADSCVYLHVLLNQEHASECMKLLSAAERGDVQLIASRLVIAEVASYRNDRPGYETAAELLERFLDTTGAEWVELDVMTAHDAARLSWDHKLRSADAVHLATATRRRADYFMSYDGGFPFDQTVSGVQVTKPRIVWTPTLEDTAPAA